MSCAVHSLFGGCVALLCVTLLLVREGYSKGLVVQGTGVAHSGCLVVRGRLGAGHPMPVVLLHRSIV
jgi:hypothetical protein